jgi:uncharacterized protein
MAVHAVQNIAKLCLILLVFWALPARAQEDRAFGLRLSHAALARTHSQVTYDPKYYDIEYPGGDVPADRGVCADVIVRSYRALSIDLQKRVHEDMVRAFSEYPQNWGLKRPDTNIDHRRVPNLRRFFERQGAEMPVTQNPADYKPGDIVTWNLTHGSGGDLPHIGIVVHKRTQDGVRPLIVHNISAGPKLEDILFLYHITGHYRYQDL